MQNSYRLNEKNLRKFLYPPRNEYEYEREKEKQKEIDLQKSPIISNRYSYLTNDNINKNKRHNLKLYYRYDDEQPSSASSYILNKELNRNALGNTKDENQFSVLDNNNSPYSYKNKENKPEGRIYHYSIASKKDYSRDKEEDYNLFYYYPEQRARKYYIEKKAAPYNERDYYHRKKEENILPTKVYISDSYPINKSETYKFRPSREKDGYKGGIVNLRRKNYSRDYENNNIYSIILIQRWWRNILYNKLRNSENEEEERFENERNNYQYYYPTASGKKIYSKGNKRITEKIIPGENDKFIVQTTRVEVFKRPYMSLPLLKPEIITKEFKVNNLKNNNFDTNKDFEIILDKDTLKQHMRNIWNEENMSTSAESLSIIQNENIKKYNISDIRRITINDYEEQIRQLKIDLNKKEKELIETNNKLKSLTNKRYLENDNYLKKDDIAIIGSIRPFDDNLKIQIVDKIFIKNEPNIESYNKRAFLFNKYNIPNKAENIIENVYNL